MYEPVKTNLSVITARTFNEYLLCARLCARHLTFTGQLILLIITQNGFYYLLYFIVESKTEKQSFRNMHQLKKKILTWGYVLLILEREGGSERERNIYVKENHRSVASRVHPDQELNPQPFGEWDDAPTKWGTWPGLHQILSQQRPAFGQFASRTSALSACLELTG